MRVRFELFVHEMGAAVAFYAGVMGFDLVREEPGYASLRRVRYSSVWDPYPSCRRRAVTSRAT